MRSRSLSVLLLALVACTGIALADDAARTRYDGHAVVRVELRTHADVERMNAISDDPWSESVGVGVVDFRVPPDRMDELRATGLRFEVVIDDVQRLIDAEQAALAQRGGAGWFEAYRSNDEVSAYCDELILEHPNIVSRAPVGTSIQARPVYALRITSPGDASDRRAVLLIGCQHAREWVSVSTVMFIADALVRGYGADQRITDILDDLIVYIVPVANPDGYSYSWTNQRLWRKNRRHISGSTYGVDLNRNWGYQWGGPGSSGSPSSLTYRGTAPFSEPETAALRDFSNARPNIVASVDVHSYSQLVLSPWGYSDTLTTTDAADLNGLASDMASEIFSVHGKTYIHGPTGSTLYVASGIASDWHYGARNEYAWTIELRDTGQYGFILPPEQIIPTGEEAFAAALTLFERARDADRVRFDGPFNAPATIPPDTMAAPTVHARAIWGAALDVASVRLLSRVGDGDFTDQTITEQSPGVFTGILPGASCGAVISYYFAASTTFGDTATWPANAPDDAFTITVTIPDAECPSLPGDVNGDGVVDFSDFSIVLSQYGQTGPGLQGDVNGDDVVNFEDFSIVLANYGSSL